MVSPTAAMVTEAAGAARELTSAAPAGLAPAAQQTGATSKAADNALTVFRMPINLAVPGPEVCAGPIRQFYSTVDVMTAAYDDVPFSELLHHPAATAERLDAVRALRLRRRDAGDLALMRIEQLERDMSVVDFTTRLLASLVRSEQSDVIRGLLRDALPWVTFLPEVDVDTFVTELLTVAQGAVELGNLAPVAVLLTQWRHSAEVYADPVLLEILTTEPDGDMGPVPAPPDEG
jgi:hypothetical protein